MNFRFVYVIWFLLAVSPTGYSQMLELLNGSFEEEPADATVPQGWLPCQPGTTPDILPGFWGVYNEASAGSTFLGLITRHNSTWESISQRLPSMLEKGGCYSWSLDLAHSDTYSGYNKPIQLRVWVSSVKCGKEQLIFESPFIEHLDWKTYKLKFTPDEDYQYILLEAFYSEGQFSHTGNILIDKLSPIHGCDKS